MFNSHYGIKEIKNIPFFFIIGRPRSGTTLLSTLFDAHPEVIVPFESPVILQLYAKYKRLQKWDEKHIHEFVNDLQSTRKFDRWNVDCENLISNLIRFKEDLDFQTAVKILYLHFPSFFKKNSISVIGDKNPVYSLFFKKIYLIFPVAKFIHLIRDYRDNILSVKKLDFEAPLTSIIAYRWKFANNLIHQISLQHPEQFYTIRYEDLIADPSSEIKQLCSFLNIRYDPSVLDFHLSVQERIKNLNDQEKRLFKKFHSNLLKPINSSKSGVWKQEMKVKDLKIAEIIAGKWAENFGYMRKYHQRNLLYFLLSLPAIMYVRLAYSMYMQISSLPFKLQRLLLHRGPVIARIITKLSRRTKSKVK